MPRSPLSGDINPQVGPLIQVTVRNPFTLSRAWSGRAAKIRKVFLVDTGSERTCLDIGIVEHLKIKTHDEHPIRNFAGAVMPVSRCAATLELWGNHGADTHDVPKLEVYVTRFIEDGPFHGILGRDVLNRCHLSYRGRERQFTLEF